MEKKIPLFAFRLFVWFNKFSYSPGTFLDLKEKYSTIGSYVSLRSSRYEALAKFGEHERYVRVALQISQAVHISMNVQLT